MSGRAARIAGEQRQFSRLASSSQQEFNALSQSTARAAAGPARSTWPAAACRGSLSLSPCRGHACELAPLGPDDGSPSDISLQVDEPLLLSANTRRRVNRRGPLPRSQEGGISRENDKDTLGIPPEVVPVHTGTTMCIAATATADHKVEASRQSALVSRLARSLHRDSLTHSLIHTDGALTHGPGSALPPSILGPSALTDIRRGRTIPYKSN